MSPYQSIRTIPVRVLSLPVPAVADHVGDSPPGLPAELPLRLRGVSVVLRLVARAARSELVGDFYAVLLHEGVHYLKDRDAPAASEVVSVEAGHAHAVPEGSSVPLREVHYVDVVPDAGPVRRPVVVSENPEVVELTDRNLGDVGHQVVRDAVRVLADEAALVGAYRVEVAEHAERPAAV